MSLMLPRTKTWTRSFAAGLVAVALACRASSSSTEASGPTSPRPQTTTPAPAEASRDLGFPPERADAVLRSSLDEVLAAQRAEDWPTAAASMQLLLYADLPRWSESWSRDPRLRGLRASPEGHSLDQRLSELRRRWAEALRDGLPLVLWRAAEEGTGDDDPYTTAPPGVLRAGVLLAGGRFVPAGPPVGSALHLQLLPARSAVVSTSATAYPGLDSMLGEVKVATWDPVTGQLLAQRAPPAGYEGPQAIEFARAQGTVWFRAYNSAASQADHPQTSSWIALDLDPPGVDPAEQQWQRVLAEGVVGVALPTGRADRKHALRLAAVDRDATFVHAAADASNLWIVTVESRCTWEGDEPAAVLRHRLRRAPASGTPVVVHEGPGAANLELLADGRALFQVGSETYVLGKEAETLEGVDPLPTGLVIVPPLRPKVCFDP